MYFESFSNLESNRSNVQSIELQTGAYQISLNSGSKLSKQ